MRGSVHSLVAASALFALSVPAETQGFMAETYARDASEPALTILLEISGCKGSPGTLTWDLDITRGDVTYVDLHQELPGWSGPAFHWSWTGSWEHGGPWTPGRAPVHWGAFPQAPFQERKREQGFGGRTRGGAPWPAWLELGDTVSIQEPPASAVTVSPVPVPGALGLLGSGLLGLLGCRAGRVRAGSGRAQGLEDQSRQGFGRGSGPKFDPGPRPTQKLHKRPASP